MANPDIEDLTLVACAKYIHLTQKIFMKRMAKHRKRRILQWQNFMKNITVRLEKNIFEFLKTETSPSELVNKGIKNHQAFGVNIRTKHFWNSKLRDPTEMLENCCMDRRTFRFICTRVRADLSPDHQSRKQNPFYVDIKVAIALNKLASGKDYEEIANEFGVHKSTIKRCLHDFCNAIINRFESKTIKIPSPDNIESNIKKFEEISGLPLILGILNTIHIPITPPKQNPESYENQVGWPSIILQVLVDSNSQFVDISCSHGSVTHETIFKDSNLINRLELPLKSVEGVQITPYIVGNPSYPLSNLIIKDYSEGKSPETEVFNECIKKAREISEIALTRLRGRWKILLKKIDVDPIFVPKIIKTCCILHNLLEERDSQYIDKWNELVDIADVCFLQPLPENGPELEGTELRNFLKEFVATKYSSENFMDI